MIFPGIYMADCTSSQTRTNTLTRRMSVICVYVLDRTCHNSQCSMSCFIIKYVTQDFTMHNKQTLKCLCTYSMLYFSQPT